MRPVTWISGLGRCRRDKAKKIEMPPADRDLQVYSSSVPLNWISIGFLNKDRNDFWLFGSLSTKFRYGEMYCNLQHFYAY